MFYVGFISAVYLLLVLLHSVQGHWEVVLAIVGAVVNGILIGLELRNRGRL